MSRLFLCIYLVLSFSSSLVHSASIEDDVHINKTDALNPLNDDLVKESKDLDPLNDDLVKESKDLEPLDDDFIRESVILDNTHYFLSDSVIGLSDWLDSFFSDERVSGKEKKSRLKIDFTTSLVKGEGLREYIKPSLRLVFPRLTRKLAFIVRDISDSFTKKDGDAGRNDLSEEAEEVDVGTYLHWFTVKRKDFHLNHDIGVKIKNPLDPFVRISLRKSWFSSTDFEFRLTGSLFLFESIGFGNRWRFEADYKLSKRHLFRFDNWSLWLKREGAFKFSNGFILFQKFNSRTVISYGSFVESVSHPLRVERYRSYARYRNRFYKQWLYFRVSARD